MIPSTLGCARSESGHMRAIALALGLLGSTLQAQEPRYNFVLPPHVAYDVVVWNGEAALMVFAPEPARLAIFLDPTLTTPPMRSVQLLPQFLAVLDTRPCAIGAFYELWFADRHIPQLGGRIPDSGVWIGPSGLHLGVPLQFKSEQPVATEWYVSYCSMLSCTSSCGGAVRGPQWTGLLATVRLN